MLITANSLSGYRLLGLDGEIAKAKEFYFEDQYWTIRYLVADMGKWLHSKQVLISSGLLDGVIPGSKDICIHLNKEQIENCPSIDTDRPVSRQFEEAYYGYYGWPKDWSVPYVWESYPYAQRDAEVWTKYVQNESSWDPHLYSTKDVRAYHIQAVDGTLGHVEDFILDRNTWIIRYLLINTRNWLAGSTILLPVNQIKKLSSIDKKVYVNLSRAAIKQLSPVLGDDEKHENYFLST